MKELLNIPISYGELTRKVIGEEPKKGGSKERQLKQIESLCRVEQQGRKYIIKEIYQEPKEIINNCKGKQFYEIKQFKVSKEQYRESGVYKIQFENKVYIGSTKDFRNRYKQHLREDKTNLPHLWELLKEEEHTFEVLEVVNEMGELRKREQYYIELYLSSGYEVVNRKKAKDEEKDKEKRKIIKVNESDYEKMIELCRNNGIEIL